MKRFMVGLFFLLLAAETLASQSLPAGKWWRLEPVIREVGLRNDQIDQIENLYRLNARAMIDLKAAVEKEQVDLGTLMDSDSPDKEKVLAQADRLESARARMARAMVAMLVDIRKMITREQWQKLQGIRARREEAGRLPGAVPRQRLKPSRPGQEPLPESNPNP